MDLPHHEREAWIAETEEQYEQARAAAQINPAPRFQN
jgi:hypothetical protein